MVGVCERFNWSVAFLRLKLRPLVYLCLNATSQSGAFSVILGAGSGEAIHNVGCVRNYPLRQKAWDPITS